MDHNNSKNSKKKEPVNSMQLLTTTAGLLLAIGGSQTTLANVPPPQTHTVAKKTVRENRQQFSATKPTVTPQTSTNPSSQRKNRHPGNR